MATASEAEEEKTLFKSKTLQSLAVAKKELDEAQSIVPQTASADGVLNSCKETDFVTT